MKAYSVLSWYRWIMVATGFVFATAYARAELKADPAEVDMGRHRQELTASSVVKLTNVGKAAVSIVHVGADCSCTAATPDKQELAPGESTKLEIHFETRSYQGEVHRRILVQTSDGDLIIPVKATVSSYDDWTVSTSPVVFPPSNRGTPVEAKLKLTYVGTGKKVDVSSVTADVPWLNATFAKLSDSEFEVTLKTSPQSPAGNHDPKITVHTTDEHEPAVVVSTFASIYSTLIFKPNPILLPVTKLGTVAAMPVVVTGWTPKEDPKFKVADGEMILAQRDRDNLLLQIKMKPSKAGTETQVLQVLSNSGIEAEIPVITRTEE